MSDPIDRDLEFDLQALDPRLRTDRGFAEELYCALCNADWRHLAGTTWHGSWRYSARLIATVRGRGEDYIDFYCTRACEEDTISDRVSPQQWQNWTGAAKDTAARPSTPSNPPASRPSG